MSKLTNLNNLDKLSKALDARYKELIDEEKARAIAEEQALQTEINITKEMFGGKSIKYVSQAEYDVLTEEEKNNETVMYFITDAEDLSNVVSNIKSIIDNNNKYRINAFDIGLQTSSSFDCTSLLQEKIDDLYNLGGGIIEFPAGNYYFKGTIMLRPKVQIQGVSDTTDFISSTDIHGTVFYHNPDTLSDFFILDDTHKYGGYVESIVVKNLRIFGKENYSNICMNLQGISHSIIENISMTGFNKDLKVSSSMITTFRNLHCINAIDTVLEPLATVADWFTDICNILINNL